MNGFMKAWHGARLGEQETPFFRKSILSVNQFSKQIPCLDVFIVKKFSPYYLELVETPRQNSEGVTSRFVTRSRRAVDRLLTLRRSQIEQFVEKEIDKLGEGHPDQEKVDHIKAIADDVKLKRLDCFKMCFRVKIVDSIDYHTA